MQRQNIAYTSLNLSQTSLSNRIFINYFIASVRITLLNDNRYLFLADKDPVNAYCWIYSTFTVSRHLKGIPGRGVASAGVGQAFPDDEARHHRYYQWVSCI